MSEILESLRTVEKCIVEELSLSPNSSEGLHLALAIVRDEIQTQEIWEEVDSMSPAEVEAYLLKEGFDLDALKTTAATLAARLSGVFPRA